MSRWRAPSGMAAFWILAGALPLLGGDAPPPSVEARVWSTLGALARDARGKPGPFPAAASIIESRVDAALSIAEGDVAIDQRVRRFWKNLGDELESLDLEGLWETLPEEEAERWRSFRLRGVWAGRRYCLRPLARGAPPALDLKSKEGGAFLDLAFEAAVRPADEDGGSYQTRLAAELGFGDVGLSRAAALTAAMFRNLELEAAAPTPAPEAVERLRMRVRHPQLRSEDLALAAAWSQTFPSLARSLEPLIELEDVAGTRSGLAELSLKMTFRDKELRERCPNFADFLDGLGPFVELAMAVEDKRGRRLMAWGLSTADRRLRMNAVLDGGRVVPVDPKGGPQRADAIDFETMRRLDFTARGQAIIEVHGVTLKIDGLTMDGSYKRSGEDAALSSSFRSQPKVEVSGEAYGIMPIWLIDVFIPDDLGTLVECFLERMTRGNNGRGLEMRTVIRRGANGRHALKIKQRSEWLDNALIRLGFKMIHHKLVPNAEARSELLAVFTEALKGLKTDIGSARRYFAPRQRQ